MCVCVCLSVCLSVTSFCVSKRLHWTSCWHKCFLPLALCSREVHISPSIWVLLCATLSPIIRIEHFATACRPSRRAIRSLISRAGQRRCMSDRVRCTRRRQVADAERDAELLWCGDVMTGWWWLVCCADWSHTRIWLIDASSTHAVVSCPRDLHNRYCSSVVFSLIYYFVLAFKKAF